jgi:NADH:ubiquinone oxidoreductase subunit E
MPPSEAEHELVICMGSSCFARGNSRAVETAREFLRTRHLEDCVHLTGTLCQDRCRQGPNLTFDGECHCEVEPSKLTGLLEDLLDDLTPGSR